MRREPEPESFLPLTAAAYHVLLALGDHALHGYAMMQALEEKTGGRDQLLPGSLYATVSRMVADGLLEQAEAPAGADGRRRYYRVTRLGRSVAVAESARLARLLEIARSEAYLPGVSRRKA
jgi:DNA-binding PadR family transcriptional regulator